MNYVVNEQLETVSHTLFRSLGSGGVYARTALFEQVVEGLSSLISRYREPGTEVLRFPPVINRAQVEKSGYLHSFPHLLGCVSCLQGSESDIRAALEGHNVDQEWVTALSAPPFRPAKQFASAMSKKIRATWLRLPRCARNWLCRSSFADA